MNNNTSIETFPRQGVAGTQEKAAKAGNGNGGHEALAKAVLTSEKDDSFALQHSILQHGDLEMELPTSWWALVKPFVHLIGWVLRQIVLAYRRLAPKPISKEQKVRRLIGPKALNLILGWIIHPFITVVREGVTTSAALDAFYAANRYFVAYFRSMLTMPWRVLYAPGAVLCWVVSNLPGPKGVRNRLRIVFTRLEAAFQAMADEGRTEIKVVELACGSAEAEIFALWSMRKKRPEVKIHLTLVDLSKSSLLRAVRLATALGVADAVTMVVADLKGFAASVKGGAYDAIGIVGFFDYRPPGSIVELSMQIRRALRVGGVFLGAHIARGVVPWSAFCTEHFIGWPGLVRRTEEEYRALLRRAGWLDGEVETIVEPIGEHIVSVAKKAA